MSAQKIRAAVMPAPNVPIELREVPWPALEPGSAMLRTLYSEVCGTDVHVHHGRLGGVPYPLIPGHVSVGHLESICGEVTDVEGERFREGDLVTFLDVHETCGRCYECLVTKQTTRCPKRKVYDYTYGMRDGPLGGWAERIWMKPGVKILRMPRGVDPAQFIAGGCGLVTAVHAIERGDVRLGRSVAVLGAGPVGQAAVATAALSGAHPVIAIGAPESRLEFARRMGASHVLDLSVPAAERAAQVRAMTGGRGVDVVIEAAGDPAAVSQALDLGARWRPRGDRRAIHRRRRGVHQPAPSDQPEARRAAWLLGVRFLACLPGAECARSAGARSPLDGGDLRALSTRARRRGPRGGGYTVCGEGSHCPERVNPMNRREFTASMAAGAAASMAAGAAAFALPTRSMLAFAPPGPLVNGQRLNSHLAPARRIRAQSQGGVTRLAYTPEDRAGREYVMKLMRDAQLEVSTDAAANIIGRRAGSDISLKPILMGSHIDSVGEGGNYDGDVGSLGAIEVAQTLAEQRVALRHPLEVVVWQNEEGGLWGSHAATAELKPEELETVSQSGKTIRDGIRFLGGNPDDLARTRRQQGDVRAYLELHIEQGPILDRMGLDIGVVEGIVEVRRWEITIDGVANHAGTTDMGSRHDAMLSAARFIELVNKVVTSVSGRQVGTVGRIQALPNVPNVIPGRVTCTLDLRDLDPKKVTALYLTIEGEAKKVGAQNGTTFTFKQVTANAAAPTDPAIRAMIEDAAKELGLKTRSMPSGAGHDAQDVAHICPIGMIFVPSVGGISHAPKEFTAPKDIENGANVLLQTLLRLDRAG